MARNYIVLYGKNSISERLKSDPKSIRKIFLKDSFKVPHIEELIKKNNLPVERLTSDRLSSMWPARDLQGIIARVEKFQYAPYDTILESTVKNRSAILFLDRINDPQNLGVIIRIAACFGNFAVVIPRHGACQVNETVLHVASGGENFVPVSMVKNLSDAVIKAREKGCQIIGTLVSDDAEDIDKIAISYPLGLILGSEGKGIRQGLQKHCNIKARIPMRGAKLSFNVSMACAIFCHEISKSHIKTTGIGNKT